MIDFSLESLGLEASVLSKLRSLGLSSIGSLRGMIDAAPDDLARYVGRDTFAALRSALESISHGRPSVDFRSRDIVHGARLGLPPGRIADPPDLELRDALFNQLQELRQDDEDMHHERIKELEARLNALLEADSKR